MSLRKRIDDGTKVIKISYLAQLYDIKMLLNNI